MEPQSKLDYSLDDSPTFDGKSCFKASKKLGLDLTFIYEGEVLYLRFNPHDIIMVVKERVKVQLGLPQVSEVLLTKVEDDILMDHNYATLSDYMLKQHSMIQVDIITPCQDPQSKEGPAEDQKPEEISSLAEETKFEPQQQIELLPPVVPQQINQEESQPKESLKSLGKQPHLHFMHFCSKNSLAGSF
ncbi:hypothetical protein FGO68_gene17124 [Halteria grandinella]|uniref:Ubiquitin-like domain-containing protein n=1 Tax=Halteria grandinella TaxID=5974 RepID=A0A8J8NCM9_HALGN|nr:hypothetical protein FGO68_gene17124 [Halteria grandinella]